MGAWIAIVLLGIVCVIILFGVIGNIATKSADANTMQLKRGSILVVELSGIMEEREQNQAPDLMTLMNGNITSVRSLEKYVGALTEAAENDNIDGIYLKCEGMSISPASLHSLHEALAKCHKNGKRIYAYGDILTQSDYLLATAADSIFINPEGSIELHGIGGYTPYFKGLLDKLGVEMQVVKVGKFKSAVEPYILTEMSQPARAQLDTLYNAIWKECKQLIANSRKINTDLIDTLINRDFISTREPELSLENKLIDGICYKHQIEEKLATFIGKKKFSDINFVDINCMFNEYLSHSSVNKNKIAVLYACGEIDGKDGGIQSKELVPLIFKLAENDDIAAMVLRINSPGGSAFGSEQIWEALEQFKASGKKLVVSMGDMAASGGYYISCGADKIFADAMTITGSIGIFGVIPNTDKLLTEKLGIEMQLVSTNPQGVFPNILKPLTENQLNSMQKMVERGYETFTSRVSKGRNLTQDKVKQIAEGRVWDARTAIKIGLVDEIGSLQKAIETASTLSNTSKYQVVIYPNQENGFWTMLSQITKNNDIDLSQIIDYETMLKLQARKILGRDKIQARMQDIQLIM